MPTLMAIGNARVKQRSLARLSASTVPAEMEQTESHRRNATRPFSIRHAPYCSRLSVTIGGDQWNSDRKMYSQGVQVHILCTIERQCRCNRHHVVVEARSIAESQFR